ncbi:MAG: COX15/CtaA family protein, partial [Candidatus Puniceispirillaceae bacterium]
VVGGITRLTESGLSMVEWRPLIGMLPPLTDAEWMRVFTLYQATPEYIHINFDMGLAQFKTIFFWEYVHRVLGRLIG